MFKDHTLQISGERAMYGLIAGAAVGAAIVITFIAFVFFTRDNLYPGIDAEFGVTLAAGAIIFLAVFAYWVSGIVILGCPIWFVLHKLGLRTWNVAIIFGFIAPFIVSFWMAPSLFIHSQYVSWSAFGNSAIYGVIGSITALTIWRIAYRRPTPC